MTRRGVSGAADNPDLELRLQRVEKKIANITPGTARFDGVDIESASDENSPLTPKYISGVYVTSTVPGVITLRWNPLDQKSIQRYEVYVSKDKTFNDPIELKKYSVSNKSNVFSFADPDDDPNSIDPPYYLKIRGVSPSGRTGPWSVVVNSQTGKATALHLGFGTDIVEDSATIRNPRILETYYPNTEFDEFSTNAGEVQVEISKPTALLCIGLINVQFELWPGSKVTAQFVVKSSSGKIDDKDEGFGKVTRSVLGLPVDGFYPLYLVDVFDPPSAGTYTFHMKFTLGWDHSIYQSDWDGGFGGFYSVVSAGHVVSAPRNWPRRASVNGYKLSVVKLI